MSQPARGRDDGVAAVPFPIVLGIITLWLPACDEPSPVVADTQPAAETTALYSIVPEDQQTDCFRAAMAAAEASRVYGRAAKELGRCERKATRDLGWSQAADSPCEPEGEYHAQAWSLLTAAYEVVGVACQVTLPPSNHPPVITSVTITPTTIYTTTSSATCTATYSDPDQDQLSVTYAWYQDGVLISTALAEVLSGPFVAGSTYQCEVTVDDGEARVTLASAASTAQEPPTNSLWENLLISEIYAYPLSGPTGEYVEIYNPNFNDAVDLTGLSMEVEGYVTISLSGTIPGGGYLLVADAASGPAGGGFIADIVAPLQLPNGGGTLRLVRGGTWGNSLTYPAALQGLSWALDLANEQCFQEATPGSPNLLC